MVTFLFEALALLIFWKIADFKRFREFLPMMIFACFVRFLDHYIMIHWLHIWEVQGSVWSRLWLPISADVTTWPIVTSLFLQFFPFEKKWMYKIGYGGLFVAMMLSYMQALRHLDVVSFQKGWHLGHSFLLLSSYFILMYGVWRWLEPSGK